MLKQLSVDGYNADGSASGLLVIMDFANRTKYKYHQQDLNHFNSSSL
jgi:hypothetical protein